MEYLFDEWDTIRDKIKDDCLFIFLDFDGTLVPIAQTPEKAVLHKKAKGLLRKLADSSKLKLAVISGRALGDIKNKVGIKNIIYSGNHGLEIQGPRIKFESKVSRKQESIIRYIYKETVNKLSGIKGVFIEDKGLSVSVHYRLVNAKDFQKLSNILIEIVEPSIAQEKIKINCGKQVYEIRPQVSWNKGKAVLWLLAKQQSKIGKKKVFPIYLGDDLTDEDAFTRLKDKGLTIFVGEAGNSQAQYYLRNTEEVTVFLRRILEAKKG